MASLESATHFHPIAKFAPKVPSFGEWIRQQYGASEQFNIGEIVELQAKYQQKYVAK
jgi:hypothetical protein